MALLQPTNITPSSFSGLGAGTVDAAEPVTVTWKVNGNSAMVAYQIIIMQNDTGSTQVFDSGKVNLDAPFYGVNYQGETQYFKAELGKISSLQNGYVNGYKLKIIQWWNASECVELSQAAFFITRDRPTLKIRKVDSPMTFRSYVFSADYAQKQGDSLIWFRWYVAQLDGTILKDTGNIYGTGDIRVEYDGFFTGQSYRVRCICQTENGVEVDTGWYGFQVQYALSELVGFMNACPAQRMNAVLVSWPAVTYINGTQYGSVDIRDGMAYMDEDGRILWNQVNSEPMNFRAPWSIVWRGMYLAPMTAWRVCGDGHILQLVISENSVKFELDGVVIASVNTTVISGEWFTVLVTPAMLYVRHEAFYGGLYPSLTLYPAKTLYPVPSKIRNVVFSLELAYQQFSIQSVELLGPQVCDFMQIEKGEMAPDQFIDAGNTQTEYGPDSYFCADFSNGLNAGNLAAKDDQILGTAVYRRCLSDNKMIHLMDADLKITRFLDYGIKNQESYVYYLFPRGENTYLSEPLISNEAKPVFWNWTVLECDEDSAGVFHMRHCYPFTGNIESGAISNNNTPTLLTNFSRYPTRQPSVQNYRSGTLRAVIGKVDQIRGNYSDSVKLAEQIWNLSTSEKPKFLRDRKGSFYRIETEAPIKMETSDGTRQQVYTMTLPWCETGSAEGVSVISVPTDTAWPL